MLSKLRPTTTKVPTAELRIIAAVITRQLRLFPWLRINMHLGEPLPMPYQLFRTTITHDICLQTTARIMGHRERRRTLAIESNAPINYATLNAPLSDEERALLTSYQHLNRLVRSLNHEIQRMVQDSNECGFDLQQIEKKASVVSSVIKSTSRYTRL